MCSCGLTEPGQGILRVTRDSTGNFVDSTGSQASSRGVSVGEDHKLYTARLRRGGDIFASLDPQRCPNDESGQCQTKDRMQQYPMSFLSLPAFPYTILSPLPAPTPPVPQTRSPYPACVRDVPSGGLGVVRSVRKPAHYCTHSTQL